VAVNGGLQTRLTPVICNDLADNRLTAALIAKSVSFSRGQASRSVQFVVQVERFQAGDRFFAKDQNIHLQHFTK